MKDLKRENKKNKRKCSVIAYYKKKISSYDKSVYTCVQRVITFKKIDRTF